MGSVSLTNDKSVYKISRIKVEKFENYCIEKIVPKNDFILDKNSTVNKTF